jgi:hypothetical protein
MKAAINNGEFHRAGVIRIFAESSDLLAATPFVDIPGLSYSYELEGVLPATDFRVVNDTYTPSNGVLNPQSEPLKIGGGEIQVDTAIMKAGPGVRAKHEALKAKSMSQLVALKLIKGDAGTSPKEFDGLEKRLIIGGAQVIDNGTTDGGDSLKISKLDAAIDACEGATHLLMRKQTRRRITSFLQNSTSIRTDRNEFGQQVMSYDNLPILIADSFGQVTPCIDDLEVGVGGSTATATSIYVLHLEEGYLHGLQNGVMRVADLGELQALPAFGTRIEWLVGMCLPHPRAAVRLRGILGSAAAAA